MTNPKKIDLAAFLDDEDGGQTSPPICSELECDNFALPDDEYCAEHTCEQGIKAGSKPSGQRINGSGPTPTKACTCKPYQGRLHRKGCPRYEPLPPAPDENEVCTKRNCSCSKRHIAISSPEYAALSTKWKKEWNEQSCAETLAAREAEVAAREAEQAAFDDPAEQEDSLKYPQLVFPYDALAEGRFKRLVDKACEGGLSAGLVVPAIMALASSLPEQDRVEGARVNMYVTLLSMVGAGKDTAIDRAGAVLGLRTDDAGWSECSCSVYTPSGERSVAMCIGDQPGTKENPARIPGPRTHCMITYELDETLRKNKGETSGVFSALQHFFDHNEKQYNDSKYRHKQTVNCRLSWLTALPVGDREIDENVYRKAFGDSSSHGFVSRMLFGFAEQRFDRRKTRNWYVPESDYSFVTETALDFGTIEQHSTLTDQMRSAKCEGFAPGVANLYEGWQPKKDWSGRDAYHALKVAIVCSILQGHCRIEESDWRFAVAFIDWQGRIRETFAPGQAQKTTQAEFNEIVVKEVQRRTQKGLAGRIGKDKHTEVVEVDGKKRVYVRWKGMSNDGKWYKHGLDTEKTVRMLVNGGTLAYKIEAVYDKKGHYVRDEKDEVWVRIVGWKPE